LIQTVQVFLEDSQGSIVSPFLKLSADCRWLPGRLAKLLELDSCMACTWRQVIRRAIRGLASRQRVSVAKLMKQYNLLFKEGKYQEAEQQARLACEMDPDDPMIRAAINIAKISRNKEVADRGKKDREDIVAGGLGAAEDEGPYTADYHIDPDSLKRAQGAQGTVAVNRAAQERVGKADRAEPDFAGDA